MHRSCRPGVFQSSGHLRQPGDRGRYVPMPSLSQVLDSVSAVNWQGAPAFHQYVYTNLDVRRCQQPATGNHHLLNPRNDEIGGFSPRDTPLTGSEEIHGDFLTLHHGSHDDMVLLLTHNSLDELVSEILNSSGLLNPFTLAIDAIVGGSCRKYNLTFSLHGTRTSFNKDAQFACEYGNDGATDMTPYSDCRIEWASATQIGT